MIDDTTLDLAVESYVDRYEQAWSFDPDAKFRDFLPARDDPKFLLVATELIRVDLELSWAAGRQRTTGHYEQLLPELKQDGKLRAEVVYEEYRQRAHHGEDVSWREFAKQYDLDAIDISTVVAKSDETSTTGRFADAARHLPASGQTWRDFEIVSEIGRGALSRVFLARQTSLARREVVLKFAPKHLLEAEKLAKLQHTNIVPVYSVYEDTEFNVFCMPYLGSRTLADELSDRQGAGSEADALRFADQIVQAIAHAHERGILHHDIKPANILVSTDSEPKLLDFNLAAERAAPSIIMNIGGTIPYMAPEALMGLADGKVAADHRSDIFSLGAVLVELITRRRPFADARDLASAVELRRRPAIVESSRKLSPSVASILTKCLCFEPADRYQSAQELHEDIQLHLRHRPLRFATNTSVKERVAKWCRRHPRLSSLTSIACVVTLLLAVAAMAWVRRERYVDRLEAASKYSAFRQRFHQLLPELSAIGLDAVDAEAVVQASEQLLNKYTQDGDGKHPADYRHLSASEQRDAGEKMSRLAFLTGAGHIWLAQSSDHDAAHLRAAERWNSVSQAASARSTPAHRLLSVRISQLTHDPTTGQRVNLADYGKPTSADDLQLVGRMARLAGDPQNALATLESACRQSSQDYSKWFDLAIAYADVGSWQAAENCLTTCLALRPAAPLAHFLRGNARYELGKYHTAVGDFSDFLESSENHPLALINRALAHKGAGNHEAALKDLDRAIELGYAGPRVWIIRGRVHQSMGAHAEANADSRQALAATPQDELDWVSRGVAVMNRDPQQALVDFGKALEVNPRSHSARRNIAYVLSEKLDRGSEAIKCLDELIALQPLDAAAYAGRGVLLARAENYDAALADADRVLQMNGGPRTVLQAACIYALVSKERPRLKDTAVELLGTAFRGDPELARLARTDPDLRDIQPLDKFTALCDAAQKLASVPAPKPVLQQVGR